MLELKILLELKINQTQLGISGCVVDLLHLNQCPIPQFSNPSFKSNTLAQK